jgi:hypothetical protein
MLRCHWGSVISGPARREVDMGLVRRVQGGIRQRLGDAGVKAARSRVDIAERVASDRKAEAGGEQVPVADSATVQQWLRDLGPDVTVLVHRPWGTVAAQGSGKRPINVFLSEGASAWFAVPPGATDDHLLTPLQVEHIVLEAMSSPQRPAWPRWVELA